MTTRFKQTMFFLFCGVLSSGCRTEGWNRLIGGGYYTDLTSSVEPQFIKSGGLLGGLLSDLAGLSFPFEATTSGKEPIVDGLELIEITDISLRTVFDTEEDFSDAALENQDLMDQCREGQVKLDFIESMSISIQKQNTSTWTRVASFDRNSADALYTECSFSMKIDGGVNILDFLPKYNTKVEAEGSPPHEDTYIGGYVSLYVEGTTQLPLKKD